MTTTPPETASAPSPAGRGRGAARVGSGIFVSRILGFVRERVFAHYFGTSDAADAFNAAFRIPNVLQNLFGEGVLSASFIPVYAGLRARDRDREASAMAAARCAASPGSAPQTVVRGAAPAVEGSSATCGRPVTSATR